MITNLLAIDPGAGGGLAWIDVEGNPHCMSMPATEGDVLDALRELRSTHDISHAHVEEVGGYCGVGMPGSAMFKFGRGFGFMLGALMAMGVRVELVKPQKWQKHFSLGTVRQSGGKTPWKNKLKSEAQRRFPSLAVTLKTADALLILDYAKAQP